MTRGSTATRPTAAAMPLAVVPPPEYAVACMVMVREELDGALDALEEEEEVEDVVTTGSLVQPPTILLTGCSRTWEPVWPMMFATPSIGVLQRNLFLAVDAFLCYTALALFQLAGLTGLDLIRNVFLFWSPSWSWW